MTILGVGEPPVTSYMSHAPIMTILAAGKDDYLPWLMNNYTQMIYNNCQLDYMISGNYYHSCPFLNTQVIGRDILSRMDIDFVTLVTNSLDLGCYVMPIVNSVPISSFGHADKTHFPHQLFIYGYDDETELFYVGDFFQGGDFRLTTAPYEEVREAYYSLDVSKWGDLHYEIGIKLFRRVPCDYYGFNLNYYKRLLQDYVESVNSMTFQSAGDTSKLYGQRAIYDYMRTNIDALFHDKWLDWRIFAVNVDHKNVLRIGHDYLWDHHLVGTNYSEAFGALKQQAEVLSLFILRMRITKRFNLENERKAYKMAADLEKTESLLLGELLESLSFETQGAER